MLTARARNKSSSECVPNGSVTSWNWAGALVLGGFVDRVYWVSGEHLSNSMKDSRKAWLERSTEPDDAEQAAAIRHAFTVLDWEELKRVRIAGKTVVSLDLDILTEPSIRDPDAFWDDVIMYIRQRRSACNSVALSAAYQYQEEAGSTWSRFQRLLETSGKGLRVFLEAGPERVTPEGAEEAEAWAQWDSVPVGDAFGKGWNLWRGAPAAFISVLRSLRVEPGDPYTGKLLEELYSNRSGPIVPVQAHSNEHSSREEPGAPGFASPDRVVLRIPRYISQSFNNCGPATLSMVLSYFGITVSQDELADLLRPCRNSRGVGDDKSLSPREFLFGAEQYGLSGLYRPGGTPELIRRYLAAGFPVVVRTWLDPGKDIGHYRLIAGFDAEKKTFITEDSYFGSGTELDEPKLEALWMPFNHQFFVLFRNQDRKEVAETAGSLSDERVAWVLAREEASLAVIRNPEDSYAWFNLSCSQYRLNDYKGSVESFEKAEPGLPHRMLWYQLDPVLAYAHVGNRSRVFELSERIFNSGYEAYSELYHLRSQFYAVSGERVKADFEWTRALRYNRNYGLFGSETTIPALKFAQGIPPAP